MLVNVSHLKWQKAIKTERVCKEKNLPWRCLVWIENPVPRDHCLASQMPNSDQWDRVFYPHQTVMRPKVWWDGLCTEGGEEQPSPTELGRPDSSVSKMVCFRTSYIPMPRGFELHQRWISTVMYELMTVTVSGFAVASQCISGLHSRDLHWLSSISRQAGPPPCNTHSVKCYAPVICNHVSYGPEE